MSRKILGLDIRRDEITAVLLTNSINGNQVTAFEHIVNKHPDRIENNTSESDSDEPQEISGTGETPFLIRALEYLSAKMDFSGCVCLAALPGEAVSFRNIAIPFKSSKDIMRVLPFELEPTIPFPIENMSVDFQRIHFGTNESLLTAIIEKDYLNDFLNTLSKFKLKPYVVSVGGYATAVNLIRQTGGYQKGVLLDIDQDSCSLCMYDSGHVCYFRNFPVDVNSPHIIEFLVSHIRQTMISFHETFNVPFRAEMIHVVGSGILTQNLGNELHQALGISVQKTNVAASSKIETVIPVEWKPEIADGALSLALLEIFDMDTINFCERPIVGKKIFTEYKERFIRTGILLGLVLCISLGGFFMDLYNMNQKVERLESKINEIFKRVYPTLDIDTSLQVQQMKNKVDELKKVSLGQKDDGEKVLTIDILNKISKSIPQAIDVEVSKLVVGTENIQIAGETDSFNSVDEMKSRLESDKIFKGVTIISATIDNATKRIRFKLKIEL